MTIQNNFEEHLFNSHYKQMLFEVIPSQIRVCSGSGTYLQMTILETFDRDLENAITWKHVLDASST